MSGALSITLGYSARPKSKRSRSARVLNKFYGEKAVHLEAYEFNFKPKQQGYAVSSIGVMEDSSLYMFVTRFRPFD